MASLLWAWAVNIRAFLPVGQRNVSTAVVGGTQDHLPPPPITSCLPSPQKSPFQSHCPPQIPHLDNTEWENESPKARGGDGDVPEGSGLGGYKGPCCASPRHSHKAQSTLCSSLWWLCAGAKCFGGAQPPAPRSAISNGEIIGVLGVPPKKAWMLLSPMRRDAGGWKPTCSQG